MPNQSKQLTKEELIEELRHEKLELMGKLHSVCGALESLGGDPNRFIKAFLLERNVGVQCIDNYTHMFFSTIPSEPNRDGEGKEDVQLLDKLETVVSERKATDSVDKTATSMTKLGVDSGSHDNPNTTGLLQNIPESKEQVTDYNEAGGVGSTEPDDSLPQQRNVESEAGGQEETTEAVTQQKSSDHEETSQQRSSENEDTSRQRSSENEETSHLRSSENEDTSQQKRNANEETSQQKSSKSEASIQTEMTEKVDGEATTNNESKLPEQCYQNAKLEEQKKNKVTFLMDEPPTKSESYEFSEYTLDCLRKVLRILWQIELRPENENAVATIIHLQTFCKLINRYPPGINSYDRTRWFAMIRSRSPIAQQYLDFAGFVEFYQNDLVLPFAKTDWKAIKSHCNACHQSRQLQLESVIATCVCVGYISKLCDRCSSTHKSTEQDQAFTSKVEAHSLSLLIARDFGCLEVHCSSTFSSREKETAQVFNDYCSKSTQRISAADVQSFLFRIGYCVPQHVLDILGEKLLSTGRVGFDSLIGWLRVYSGTKLNEFRFEDWTKDTIGRIAKSSDTSLWSAWLLATKLRVQTGLHLHRSRTKWILMAVQSSQLLPVLNKAQIDFERTIGKYSLASLVFEVGDCSALHESPELTRLAIFLQTMEPRQPDDDLLARQLVEEQLVGIAVDEVEAEKAGFAKVAGISFVHVDLMLRDKVPTSRVDHLIQVFNILSQKEGTVGSLLHDLPGFITVRAKFHLAKTPSGKRVRSIRFSMVFQLDGMGWCDIFGIPKLKVPVIDSFSININMLPSFSQLFSAKPTNLNLASSFVAEGTWSVAYRREDLSTILKNLFNMLPKMANKMYTRESRQQPDDRRQPFARPKTRSHFSLGNSWDPYVPTKSSFFHKLIHVWDTVQLVRDYTVQYKFASLTELLLGKRPEEEADASNPKQAATWHDLTVRQWLVWLYKLFNSDNGEDLDVNKALSTVNRLLYVRGAVNEIFKGSQVLNWGLSYLKTAQRFAKKAEVSEERTRNAMLDEAYSLFRECILGLVSVHYNSGRGTGIHFMTSGLNLMEDNDDLFPDLAYYLGKS